MAGHFLNGFNLYVGDGPAVEASKHLLMDSCTLPELKEKTTEHSAGGAVMDIEIGTGTLEKLVVPFALAGYDPHTLGQFGLGSGVLTPYTVYGVLVDTANSRKMELLARIQGRLTSAKQDEMKSGETGKSDFEITGILNYELFIDKTQIYDFSFEPPRALVMGRSLLAEANSILRIPA